MRAILVSGVVLGVAAVFGLGVVVGRFVLTDDQAAVDAPTNAIMGPSGLDNPLGDPNAVLGTDPSLNAPPPTIAAPLPPAVPPGTLADTSPSPISARTEADAAMAAGSVAGECSIRVTQNTPVRSWNTMDRVTATAIGQTCSTGIVRILLESAEGAALYSLQAPARDFGISDGDSADAVRARLTQLLPSNAVRAAAYPQWQAGGEPPTRNEFTQETYEAVRAANSPVVCLKLPTATQRCVAADPATGQVKVFSRG